MIQPTKDRLDHHGVWSIREPPRGIAGVSVGPKLGSPVGNDSSAAHAVCDHGGFNDGKNPGGFDLDREGRIDRDPPSGSLDRVSGVARFARYADAWFDHRYIVWRRYYASLLMASRVLPPRAPEAPPPPQRRSRTGWRVLIGVLIAANVVVFGAYFALRYYTGRLASEVGTNTEVVGELSSPPVAGGPINFLLIGSDSREALPDEFGDFGNFAGQRADVIMVAQLDGGRMRILSLPRDLKVDLDGRGTQKINAAYAFGGAPLMVRTVKDVTGLEIHHYGEIDFFGFAQLVDELGGVTINFPYPARDLKSGLDVPGGDVKLDGATALAYARSRQYQELRNGSWVSVDGSDIGRIQRQQRLIFAMLSAAKRPSIVFDAGSIISALGDHVSTDATLDSGTLIDLALQARSLGSDSIETMTLPTQFQTVGGVSYLVPDEPAAGEMLQQFASPASEAGDGGPPPVGDIVVRVLNGNGTGGQATEWSDRLTNLGFTVASVGDAESFEFAATTIETADAAIGAAVVERLGFGVVQVTAVPDGVDAVVIVGSDALER